MSHIAQTVRSDEYFQRIPGPTGGIGHIFGRNGQKLPKKKCNILVVNSDGNKFKENEWMYSETYHYQKQSKNIISDKYTRNYLKLSSSEKKISKIKIWGN